MKLGLDIEAVRFLLARDPEFELELTKACKEAVAQRIGSHVLKRSFEDVLKNYETKSLIRDHVRRNINEITPSEKQIEVIINALTDNEYFQSKIASVIHGEIVKRTKQQITKYVDAQIKKRMAEWLNPK